MKELAPLIWILFWLACFGGLGFAIGGRRNRPYDGFLLGILLGPLGWLIVSFLPVRYRRKCPECLGGVPMSARRCKHCGYRLPDPDDEDDDDDEPRPRRRKGAPRR